MCRNVAVASAQPRYIILISPQIAAPALSILRKASMKRKHSGRNRSPQRPAGAGRPDSVCHDSSAEPVAAQEVLSRLSAASAKLRAAVASAITRKRAPKLLFRLL